MNKLWHSENKMPPKPALEQRIQWHSEHQLHCACREAPKSLLPHIKSPTTPKNFAPSPR